MATDGTTDENQNAHRIAEITAQKEYNNGDPLDLQSSDHPGMSLVTSPLIGTNYLSWNRLIKIALGAKMKLGFINGDCVKPVENSSKQEQWIRVDCMVRSWILNSISKEIVEAFIYTVTAKELWTELEQRYGECNGPLMYQLQREISSISQGTLSVEKYFTKLKRLWDELICLMPMPICTCTAQKEVTDLTSFTRLMQFLMGLNDTFDNIRNQILVMDPLPAVNKAYSMILRVEKQREVYNVFPEVNDNSAMFTKFQPYRNDTMGRSGGSRGYNGGRFGFGGGRSGYGGGKPGYNRNFYGNARGTSRGNNSMDYCDHCNVYGHSKDKCFKIHGYPDWYKQLGEQRTNNSGGGKAMANMMDSPLDLEEDYTGNKAQSNVISAANINITNLVQQELMKALKGKALIDVDKQIHFAHLKDYAGPAE